ncbi:DNA primase family protein [Burkholderia cepacia]|uniref:DNA primase family protein n=1 Tax=Burkholderia cepacia TaxID=292 RepID=UPI001CF427D4|nr:phage/plasmid primase, P4 family [Burkholderia cepacia]MCA8137307.1 phage/plasmid primase, P4 family [Burkholderia cepacia]
MSAATKFKPIDFAKMLERSGTYASADGLLYEWTGTHWTAMADDEVERFAIRWIDDCGEHGEASGTNAAAAYKTAVLWLPKLAKATQVAVIPVQNGYLHIDGAVTLRPHDKTLGLRHVLNCDYEPGAPMPREFGAFLERVLPDGDVRSRVQEYIGYTLLPDARYQRAQLWVGSGANGKGTLANLVQALHARTAAVQLDRLEGFRLSNMVGASLIYCDEAPQRNINEQIIKSLIAGETVQIDRKYRDPISTRITAKWLALANQIPAVRDQSNGFWRRFDIVPFDVEIPASERDPMLANRIIAHELSGVLNWALEGLMRLLARGRFDECAPVAIQRAIRSARIETNSVQAWTDDRSIELSTSVDTSKTAVYGAYATWCKTNGMVPDSSPRFWKRLPDTLGKVDEGRMTTGTGRIRTCNVRL